MGVKFEDNSDLVKRLLEEACIAGLEEAASEIQTQAEKNTPVDTGQLKGAWGHNVDEAGLYADIGNTMEHAIWNEFGTGEYALDSKGRKGGWSYMDDEGKWKHTLGLPPRRMLWNAFISKRGTVKKILENAIKSRLG